MKLYQFLAESTKKLKTEKGSVIKRSPKYGVGKEMGGTVYIHKAYENEIPDISNFKETLEKEFPDFKYNIIKYSPKSVSFLYSPDFDSSHEPLVTDYAAVKEDGSTKKGTSKTIYHHKWLFVKDDYGGFNVDKSYTRSYEWLKIPNIDFRRIGSSREFWLKFLRDNKKFLPSNFEIK